jgi:hypothetical protein
MQTPANERSKTIFAGCVSALVLGIGLFTAWHHELWLDEAYHYLLARDSGSVIELVRNGSGQGHPVGWNMVLFFYKQIFPGIFAMQFLHCFIGALCIFIIGRYAPFSKVEVLMIALGYYFIYEYNVIAKNYVLGITLLFTAMVLAQKNKPLWLIALLLGFAANQHLFTLFVSASLFLFFIVAFRRKGVNRHVIISSVIFLLFCITAVYQVLPHKDVIDFYRTMDELPLFSMSRFRRAFVTLAKGLINIPNFTTIHFWNSNVFYSLWHGSLYLLGAGLLPVIYFSFRKDKMILLLFMIPSVLLMMFVYLVPLETGIRYWGFYYILLVICTWLLRENGVDPTWARICYRAILFISCLSTVPALIIEYQHPFSNGKQAAALIGENRCARFPVFVEKLAMGPPLSAYLGKKIFYPSDKSFQSYSFRIKLKDYSAATFIEQCSKCMIEMKIDTCVAIMDHEWNENRDSMSAHNVKVRKLFSLTEAMLVPDNYYGCLLTR